MEKLIGTINTRQVFLMEVSTGHGFLFLQQKLVIDFLSKEADVLPGFLTNPWHRGLSQLEPDPPLAIPLYVDRIFFRIQKRGCGLFERVVQFCELFQPLLDVTPRAERR